MRDSLYDRTIAPACRGILLVFSVLLAACAEREAGSSAEQTPAAHLAPRFATTSLQKLSSAVVAGGIPTEYDAYFDGRQLQAIVEQRQSSTGIEQGEYLFTGARLVQYSGSALGQSARTGTLELKFDLQGRLQAATHSGGSVAPLEQPPVDAIRTRADLLRSHALAQRSSHTHRQEGHGR